MAVNNSGIYENLMLFGFLLKEPNNCWLETKKSMNANIATSVKPCVRGGAVVQYGQATISRESPPCRGARSELITEMYGMIDCKWKPGSLSFTRLLEP